MKSTLFINKENINIEDIMSLKLIYSLLNKKKFFILIYIKSINIKAISCLTEHCVLACQIIKIVYFFQ